MKFEDVLDYLEQMIGLNLQPINESNETLVILEVDRDNSRYTVDKTTSTRKRTRPFSELKKILSVLNQKSYASVEQALNGAGSSRHQPETIFANFPCVEHFKYDKRKHLYLRDSNTHSIGTLKELSNPEARELKRRIDRYRDFDISQFYFLHNKQISLLEDKLSNIFTKYPGEGDVETISDVLKELQNLEVKLSESIVTLDLSNISENKFSDNQNGDDNERSGNDYQQSDNSDDGDDNSDDEDSSIDDYSIITHFEMSRINQVSPTVSLLFDRVKYNEIDLQPEFQRGDRVWPVPDKSRLIESVLLGLPIPVLYFAEKENTDPDVDADYIWVVIDGLQRTTALIGYMRGDYELKGLKRLKDYNDLTFNELPRKEQRKIREYQLFGHLIPMSNDSDAMIREIFHRINTYGKTLSPQEIRSALYQGPTNRFLKYVADSDEFLSAIPASISSNRMLDLEYVLRAVAFLIFGYENYTYNTNDDFLSHAMKVLNKYKYPMNSRIENADPIYSDLMVRLTSSLESLTLIFGDDAYKKEPGGRVNKVLFETLVSLFAMMTDEEREKMVNLDNANYFKKRLFEAIENNERISRWESTSDNWDNRGFEYAITNSTSKRITVLYRFRSIVEMINEVPGMQFNPEPMLENFNKKQIGK
ncbi:MULTISPECIES: DUF262 domain-containing protein [Vibrio]|nr:MULTISPECIES: DUF262 domain-containing protein [Vibrio]EGQ8077107.1 DUF262 domain-containing protein [Vibrio vulnificus]HCG8488393.1 DUF262 domain-containing protein [Vibrio parahaemolyticus]EIA1302271.1 DUF262 domain-containing protein [Vibrio vulnificus]EIY9459919.1 DUF262 domain-containing protein [Vibrio vulnificus]EIY9463704.1 DUF262 domain-containing protein [Vibrio vulnificus]